VAFREGAEPGGGAVGVAEDEPVLDLDEAARSKDAAGGDATVEAEGAAADLLDAEVAAGVIGEEDLAP
jgi:hypothetical protein